VVAAKIASVNGTPSPPRISASRRNCIEPRVEGPAAPGK
jgi:hypothetical protein